MKRIGSIIDRKCEFVIYETSHGPGCAHYAYELWECGRFNVFRSLADGLCAWDTADVLVWAARQLKADGYSISCDWEDMEYADANGEIRELWELASC